MKMLLQPAKQLMNRLTYSRKMFVAGIFLCIPTLLLAYFLVTNIYEQITFSAKERAGVRYAASLDSLLQAVIDSRYAAVWGGKPRIPVDQALTGLAEVDALLGGELGMGEAFKSLKTKLPDSRGGATRQVIDAHGTFAAELLEMKVLVADRSNLTLDPDIPSYYLMDALITKLPPLAETVSRAAIVAARLSGGPESQAGDRAELLLLSGGINTLVDALKKDIRTAAGANAAIRDRIQKPLLELETAMATFQKELKGTRTVGLSRAGMEATDAAFRAASQLSPVLDELLGSRISTLQLRMSVYLSLSLVAFLLGIYFNLACYLSVKEGISAVHDAARKVSNGDLTVEARLSSRDEIGETCGMFNTMTDNLRRIIVTLAEVTEKIHANSGAIASTMDQQSGFATQLSSSVVEISSTMEEFSSTASQIALHSQAVVERADKTLEDTKNGAAEVENLTFKVNDISGTIQANLSEIVDLGRKSKEINKVMEIINNIANQTKLIAFNAALEAASAGESGKRFGVVAVEIRRLADSVVESTSEIEGKITEILDAVNRLVMSSEKSFQLIQEGQEYASHTVVMLIESVDGVEETTSAARQISLSTQQQQIASSQVVLALKDIEQGVRFSTDSIHRTNGVTEELFNLSEQLRDLVMTFKVGKEGGGQEAAPNAELR